MTNALIAAVVALLLLLGMQTVRLASEKTAHATTQVECATAAKKASDELASATTKARETEQLLQAKANQDRKKADETIEALTRQRNALRTERMRNNAAANASNMPTPSEPPGAAQTASEHDGAELSGSVGSAEEDEALRADIIRVELLSCYRAYERATNLQDVDEGEK